MTAKKVDHHEDPNPARRNRSKRANKGVVSFALVDGEMLKYACAAVAQRGGALRLGYTRDGGAFAIGVYGDGDPYTEYIDPHQDVNEFLKDLAEDWGNVQGDGSII